MRLKILIVPFFIIMVLIMIIGYIKPDIDTIQTKRVDRDTKEAQVADMQNVIKNANALNVTLDNQKESEQFVLRFLPKSLDHSRIVDIFNVLASQSGVLISGMELKPDPNQLSDGGVGVETVNPDGSTVEPPLTAKDYIATVKVQGTYENIKMLFYRLAHVDRLIRITSFGIEVNDILAGGNNSQSADAIIYNTNDLIGTFSASLDYLPEKKVSSAITVPIFQHADLDLTSVQKLVDRVSAPVPVFEKPTTGKANPFLQ